MATQKHFLGLALLSGCPLTAANVNGDSTVDTIDVIAIQRFFLGVTMEPGIQEITDFTPVNRTYSGVTSSQSGQNYSSFVFGDVVPPFAE